MITVNTTLDELFTIAVSATRDVEVGEVYIVKDLFRGFEWNRIAKSNRTKLGSLYLSYAQHAGAADINILDKTPQNQQKYEKKDL